ncbi:NAD(P)(+) transhydrogenase (Re/Si-specific) subunit beta, partial [Glycomyces dulcitolivorans]|uniref:NAD(P)(+) transhydrogenase (Re/Si-specific) subunit beta n=1 Tax=Glycomyces dulcitolivorans TaxID=2200759 RepID=UPI0018E51424
MNVDTAARYVLLGAAVCFVLGLRLMNSPATARRGNLLSAAAMAAAVAAAVAVAAARGTATGIGWVLMA